MRGLNSYSQNTRAIINEAIEARRKHMTYGAATGKAYLQSRSTIEEQCRERHASGDTHYMTVRQRNEMKEIGRKNADGTRHLRRKSVE